MTDLKKLPAWLVVTADSATVTLSRPSEINSVVVDRLTLRSPTVREVRAANATAGGDDEAREMHLFASLSESGIKDLEGLKLTDYQRLQAAYFRLVQDDGV
ncbi:phage tail assembly protein [Pseudomonas proteolytica]|uniref:Phage tail assembly protein n=1 Tax=Pseudomonas proteolytica TaxID=219574 RepID=A0AAW5A665_9PSED|nr:phage tail assembly protein [Pseudomonas proteolytica]MCF5056834.1 phage tail assembly protein [Pseudomonas proteolytica]MCF5100155.1 phage tail assembly protein [Pseudomonas proteolytica]